MVVVAIVGIAAAIAVPSIVAAVARQKREAQNEQVERAINQGRDIARERLQCVTVSTALPPQAGCTVGIGVVAHDCSATNTDANADGVPDDVAPSAEVIGRFYYHGGASLLTAPGAGCVGTPPPAGCYAAASTPSFHYEADGSTDAPYRVIVQQDDSTQAAFLIQHKTGTVRRVTP